MKDWLKLCKTPSENVWSGLTWFSAEYCSFKNASFETPAFNGYCNYGMEKCSVRILLLHWCGQKHEKDLISNE